ncbi:MAG: phosphate ABC transporter permease PstA [Spirochaetia bacterium]|nr:phosphate ABC transporter permease PstA [Spirochaetia bacterium]
MSDPIKKKKKLFRDEAYIWFTSMGLAVGIGMVVFLLGVILVNGISVFWPRDIVEIRLKDGSSAGVNNAPAFYGEIVAKQSKKIQETAGHDLKEWQLFTANKDKYGQGFKFIDVSEIKETVEPETVMRVERMEYGPAIGLPVSIQPGLEGEPIPFDSPEFSKTLKTKLKEIKHRRDHIRSLEKNGIGHVNARLESLQLREKVLNEKIASAEKKDPSKAEGLRKSLEKIAAKKTTLGGEFEKLSTETRKLRGEQEAGFLTIKLGTGEESQIALGQLVDVFQPNDMNLFEKTFRFAGNLIGFLWDEPREANTEGGIFPAIFGTFVMTLMMSVAVMPFGVVAAIYLREYAKQGLFVRAVRIAVNNLAGVPSIVFGVFGLGFFVYIMGGTIDKLFFPDKLPTPTFGTGGVLWTALTLALMTVPVVIVATEESLASVSRGVREGALACGASKWQTIWSVVLPAAGPGILTGFILSMARGAGEVAPLMLVGVVKLAPTLPIDGDFPFFHLERKFMHLGFHIYDLGFQSPDSEAAKPMVFATTLFLIALVISLNLGAIWIRNYLRKKYATGAF